MPVVVHCEEELGQDELIGLITNAKPTSAKPLSQLGLDELIDLIAKPTPPLVDDELLKLIDDIPPSTPNPIKEEIKFGYWEKFTLFLQYSKLSVKDFWRLPFSEKQELLKQHFKNNWHYYLCGGAVCVVGVPGIFFLVRK
jgi:hypothetical protein